MERRDFINLLGLSLASSSYGNSFSLEDIVNVKKNSSENEVRTMVKYFKESFIPKAAYKDEELQRSIRKISEPLFQTSNKDYDWQVYVVDNPRFEACTLGAGLILFNKNFLKMCNNEIELASVIAHEIGHNHYNHQSTKKDLMKVYSSFNIEKMDITLTLLNKSFSRHNERQADSFIIKAFLETNYNINEASIIFRKFEKLYPSSSNIDTCIFSTHPQHIERITKLEAIASTFSQFEYRTEDSDEFEYIKKWSRS